MKFGLVVASSWRDGGRRNNRPAMAVKPPAAFLLLVGEGCQTGAPTKWNPNLMKRATDEKPSRDQELFLSNGWISRELETSPFLPGMSLWQV